MVFSTHLFVFYFLPLFLVCYALIPRRGRNGLLALFSYVFYGWSNPAFMPLMLFSTLVDFFCGRYIERARGQDGGARKQKALLWVSILVNLSLLGFFKYFHFGVDSFLALVRLLG